jgi:Kef-type K+ transport system membrane component KefB
MARAEPAGTGDAAEPAAAGQRQGFLGELTQADRRAFVLGIAGGVIVNVITAFILALAYLLARSYNAGQHSDSAGWAGPVLMVIILLILCAVTYLNWRLRGAGNRRITQIAIVVAVFSFIIGILTLLGDVTGLVK